jgi:hypothetical protein
LRLSAGTAANSGPLAAKVASAERRVNPLPAGVID